MGKLVVAIIIGMHFVSISASAALIDDFEDVASWVGLTQENTLVFAGSGAGRWDNHVEQESVIKTLSPAFDASDSDFISMMLHSQVSNNAGILWLLRSENPNFSGLDYYRASLKLNWTGWRYIKILRTDFATIRTPLGWNNLTHAQLTASWGNTPAADSALRIDDMRTGKNWIQAVTPTHYWNGADYVYHYRIDIQNPDNVAATVTSQVLFLSDILPEVTQATTTTLDATGSGYLEVEFQMTSSDIAAHTALELFDAQILLKNSSHVLDGQDITLAVPLPARQSPRLYIEGDDILSMGTQAEQEPWAENAKALIVAKADGWPASYETKYNLVSWALPPEGGQWLHRYVCPIHEVALEYKAATDQHQCPVNQEFYTGWPYDEVIYTRRHADLADHARELGLAYNLTDNIAYAYSAKDILLAYAAAYLTYPIHDKDGGESVVGARVSAQTLDEAIWLIDIAWSYDLVVNSGVFSAVEEKEISKFLRDVVAVISRYDAGTSNWQSWHNAAIGAVGCVLEDWGLLGQAVGGDSGFLFQMDNSVLGDGAWYEGAWGYHFYALDALTQLAEGATRAGYDLWSNNTLEKMLTIPLNFTMPDGRLPAFNDSTYISISHDTRTKSYEMAYRRLGTPELTIPIEADSRGVNGFLYGEDVLLPAGQTWTNQSAMAQTFTTIEDSSEAHSGQRYAQLGWDFSNTTLSAYGLYQMRISEVLPNEVPAGVRFWIKGDNSGHELKVRLYDINDERFIKTIGPVNWVGWKFFQLDSTNWVHIMGDGVFDLPVKQIAFTVEASANTPGTIGVDDISFDFDSRGTVVIKDFEINTDSQIFPSSGYAILRAQDDAGSDSYLALDYGAHGGAHGHYDKLGFISYAQKTLLGLDPGMQSYSVESQNEWYKTTLAHNTVVVDETSQVAATGNLISNFLGQSVSMVQADAGASYPQADLTRTMVMVGDYILDCFKVDATDGSAHQYDWAYHNNGTISPGLLTPNVPLLPSNEGYQYLENAASVTVNDDFQTEFTMGLSGSKSIGKLWTNQSAMGQTFTAIEDSVAAHSGQWYAQLGYDFSNTTVPAYGLYQLPLSEALPHEIPTGVRVWIKGDNSGHKIAVRIYDAQDERFIKTIGPVNWIGWQSFLLTDLANWGNFGGNSDGIIDLPIQMIAFQLTSEAGLPENISGAIGVDDISFEYSNSDPLPIDGFEQWRAGVRLHTLGVSGTELVVADALGLDLRVSTPMVLLRRNSQSTVFETLLENFELNPKINHFAKLSSDVESYGYHVDANDYEDVIFWTDSTTLGQMRSFGDFQTDGGFAYYRRHPDGTSDRVATGQATKLIHNNVTVFQLGHALPSFEAQWLDGGTKVHLQRASGGATTLILQEANIVHVTLEGVADELTFTRSNGLITVNLPSAP